MTTVAPPAAPATRNIVEVGKSWLIHRAKAQLARRGLALVRDPFARRVVRSISSLGISTVIDVGANTGQYSVELRQNGFQGRIVSCEPMVEAYHKLCAQSAKDAQWTAVCTALGSQRDELIINVAANSVSSSFLPAAQALVEATAGAVSVASEKTGVITVLDLIEEHRIDPGLTLLKIDTQGYESLVLDGAGDQLGRFRAVQLELSYVMLYEGQMLADQLVRRMTDSGFRLYGMEAGFCHPDSGRMLQADALFARVD
jgi:FkbM family methyltransferase